MKGSAETTAMNATSEAATGPGFCATTTQPSSAPAMPMAIARP